MFQVMLNRFIIFDEWEHQSKLIMATPQVTGSIPTLVYQVIIYFCKIEKYIIRHF